MLIENKANKPKIKGYTVAEFLREGSVLFLNKADALESDFVIGSRDFSGPEGPAKSPTCGCAIEATTRMPGARAPFCDIAGLLRTKLAIALTVNSAGDCRFAYLSKMSQLQPSITGSSNTSQNPDLNRYQGETPGCVQQANRLVTTTPST